MVGGPAHLTGSLSFPNKRSPVSCYFLPSSDLAHSLFGVSPLIRPHGHAIFTNSSCSLFFDSSSAALPFLTGVKALEADLWHLSVPSVPRFPPQPHLAPIPLSPSAFFSALRCLLASRLWLAISLHLSVCPQTRFHSRHPPTLLTTLSPNIPLYLLYPLRSGTWICSARTYPRPDRRSLPLALAPFPLSLQPVALAPALPPSTTPFLPTTP